MNFAKFSAAVVHRYCPSKASGNELYTGLYSQQGIGVCEAAQGVRVPAEMTLEDSGQAGLELPLVEAVTSDTDTTPASVEVL